MLASFKQAVSVFRPTSLDGGRVSLPGDSGCYRTDFISVKVRGSAGLQPGFSMLSLTTVSPRFVRLGRYGFRSLSNPMIPNQSAVPIIRDGSPL